MKKKMYLSLPISGRNLKDVRDYAKRLKQVWQERGYDIITPFEVSTALDMPYSYYMGRDVEAILNCDGIIMCSDWFGSRGCRLEYSVAEIYKKKIMMDTTIYRGRYDNGTDNQV